MRIKILSSAVDDLHAGRLVSFTDATPRKVVIEESFCARIQHWNRKISLRCGFIESLVLVLSCCSLGSNNGN